MKEAKDRNPARHLQNAISYIENPDKTQDGHLVDYVNTVKGMAYKDMVLTKKSCQKTDGRQGYHIIISFVPGETTPEMAHQIAGEFAERFLDGKYEAVYATHDDVKHIHSHIVFNSVSWKTKKKYRYNNGDWRRIIQPIVNDITSKYGLSIMINTKGNNSPYNAWKAEKEGKVTWREIIRNDIDELIGNVGSIGGLGVAMESLGYKVKYERYSHDISFLPFGAKRYIRASSLGDGYTIDDIMSNLNVPNKYSKKRNFRPYRKKLKLTKLEAYYYRYKFMLGKTSRVKRHHLNPRDKLKLNTLQERVIFLHTNGIHTISDLEKKLDDLSRKESSAVTRRVGIYRQMKGLKKTFELLSKYEALELDEMAYLNGDEYYKKNYEIRANLKKNIENFNQTTVEVLLEKRQHYNQGLQEVKQSIRDIKKEVKLCENIHKEYLEDREKQEEREKEIKQEKRRRHNG